MAVTDQLKIIENKIKENQAQYDLDRLAAEISAYSFGDLWKYEYLTGEDLEYKPTVFEQAKFDYSPSGMLLTNNTKSETNKKKVDNQNKTNKKFGL